MKIIISVLALSLALPSNAASIDGNHLLSQCSAVTTAIDQQIAPKNDKTYGDAMLCLGFMQGIIATNSLLSSTNRKPFFCAPSNGISNGQATRIVLKHLQENPAKLHIDGVLLSVLAFNQAFPCER